MQEYLSKYQKKTNRTVLLPIIRIISKQILCILLVRVCHITKSKRLYVAKIFMLKISLHPSVHFTFTNNFLYKKLIFLKIDQSRKNLVWTQKALIAIHALSLSITNDGIDKNKCGTGLHNISHIYIYHMLIYIYTNIYIQILKVFNSFFFVVSWSYKSQIFKDYGNCSGNF